MDRHAFGAAGDKNSVWCFKQNKATRSPEISREQVQKLTPQILFCIYWI